MTIDVKIIADSEAEETGKRITTWELYFPRTIHAEFMTHRRFGRNAASSRAIPTRRMHERIRQDPFIPHKLTLDEPGMQGHELLEDPDKIEQALKLIRHHREVSIAVAESLAQLGLHKQIVNRYTEAHQHIRVVVTSTEWKNWFQLRAHSAAEPHIQELAYNMLDIYESNNVNRLQRGQWHLPYYYPLSPSHMSEVVDYVMNHAGMPSSFLDMWPPHSGKRSVERLITIAISAARCARTSYDNFEGKVSTPFEDIDLFIKLVGSLPVHASPLEHQATPDWQIGDCARRWINQSRHGNLIGWQQARKYIPWEDGDA